MQNSETTTDERRGLPSASSWFRHELCPANWQLTEEAKRVGQLADHSTGFSSSGSRCHSVMEGKEVPDLTPEEKLNIEKISSYSKGEIERLFGTWAPSAQVHRELRLWIKRDGKPVASGKADLVVISGARALIQDYKFGFEQPDQAHVNPQLKVLAVGLGLSNPVLTEIIVQIVSGPYGVSEMRYDVPKLATAWREIMATVDALNDPQAPAYPSILACRRCPAILICKAVKHVVWKVTKYQIQELPDDPDKAGNILDDCVLVENLITEVKEHYYAKLSENPEYKITRWALAPGSKKRELTNAEEAKRKLIEFIDPQKFEELANYSIPELQKLVAKRFNLKGKKAEEKLAEILGETLTYKQGKPLLKRDGEPILERNGELTRTIEND